MASNSPFSIEYAIPGAQKAPAGLSIFNLDARDESLEQDRFNRRNSFAVFVTSRNKYLDRLTTLGDNWISGVSKQPTDESVKASKTLLSNIGYWYCAYGYKNFIYPKVIMSPTPAGGIAMEIEVFPDMRAFVTILNEKLQYEVETNGHFVEYEATNDTISKNLLALYNKDTNQATPSNTASAL